MLSRTYGTVVYCTPVSSWLPQGVYNPSHPGWWGIVAGSGKSLDSSTTCDTTLRNC